MRKAKARHVAKTVEALLQNGAAALGVKLYAEQIDIFSRYIKELVRWNATVNLTGARTSRELVLKHILDSLAGLPVLPAEPVRLVDIGTGAGFPGLPLKIARPDIDVTLIESSHKKAAFLLTICNHLGLQGVRVLCERAELVHDQFDLAVSRAVGPPARVAALALPLVKPSGHLLLYLGPRGAQQAGGQSLAGWRWAQGVPITLPFGAGARVLSLWQRPA